MATTITKKLFGSFFDIRKGEHTKTFLMFTYLLLVLFAYYILKPVRNSLFLNNFDIDKLPYLYILIALVVGAIASLYTKFSASFSLNKLITSTLIIVISVLVLFWWLLRFKWPWLYYAFYIWVSIFSILTTAQFWLLANMVFNPREGKRLFGFIGTGAIIGATFGGTFTSFVVGIIGTENLLLCCSALLALIIVISNYVWHHEKQHIESVDRHKNQEARAGRKPNRLSELFPTILRSRHLTLISGIIAITFIVSTLVDFQFSAIAKQTFKGDDLTAFFGKFFSGLSIISFILQFFLTAGILRRLGVVGAILFLPIGIMLGTIGILFSIALLPAIILKTSEGGFRYSINRSGMELLYLPISIELKKKTKAFIDMFVDRFSRGIGGGILILCTAVLSLSIGQIGIVVLGLVVIWIFMAIMIRKEYVRSVRTSLQKKTIDTDQLTVDIKDATTIRTLISALGSPEARQVVYALDLLESAQEVPEIPELANLIHHESEAVRYKALRVLGKAGNETIATEVEGLLTDKSNEVRSEAVHYLCAFSGENPRDVMRNFLESSDHQLQTAAIDCIAEYEDEAATFLDDRFINSLLDNGYKKGEPTKILAAKALGLIDPGSPLQGYLPMLLNDKSPKVVSQAVVSTGKVQRREFIPILINKLNDKVLKCEVREALAAYGDRVLGTLKDYLGDESEDIYIRKNIPDVLFLIGTQEALHVLMSSTKVNDVFLRHKIIKALSKMKNKYPTLSFDPELVETNIVDETKSYYEILLTLHSYSKDRTSANENGLLNRALKERLDQNLERIFRLLGIRYPQKDIYFAYGGLTSDKSSVRASAVELLDNLLDRDLKKMVLPIVDEVGIETIIDSAQALFQLETFSGDEALAELIGGTDNWLKACAIHTAGQLGRTGLIEEVKKASSSSDAVVKETADSVLSKWA